MISLFLRSPTCLSENLFLWKTLWWVSQGGGRGDEASTNWCRVWLVGLVLNDPCHRWVTFESLPIGRQRQKWGVMWFVEGQVRAGLMSDPESLNSLNVWPPGVAWLKSWWYCRRTFLRLVLFKSSCRVSGLCCRWVYTACPVLRRCGVWWDVHCRENMM